jgi:hypothetical protein
MWQIVWMLTFVPDWIYHAILIVGVVGILAGKFLRFIPVVSAYSPAIRITSMILFVVGVWFNGSIYSDNKWRAKVADLESQVAMAEQQASEANAQIEIQYVDRIRVVREKEYIIQSEIREYSGDLDANCIVSPRAREILNRAAEPPKETVK